MNEREARIRAAAAQEIQAVTAKTKLTLGDIGKINREIQEHKELGRKGSPIPVFDFYGEH